MNAKSEVRHEALATRRKISSDRLDRLSDQVQKNLEGTREFAEAATLATYVAKEDEVQTRNVIIDSLKMGKEVLVPRVGRAPGEMRFYRIRSLDELRAGSYGVLEPLEGSRAVPLSRAQMVLVPVVAWDDKGHRVGYGGGYFDRSLKSRGGAVAAGLALESQRRAAVPASDSDVGLQMLVTEKRVYRFGGAPR